MAAKLPRANGPEKVAALVREHEWIINAVLSRRASIRFFRDEARDDVAQELRLVLVRAAEVWQPGRAEFKSYAYTCVWHRAVNIIIAMRDARKFERLPRHLPDTLEDDCEPDGPPHIHRLREQIEQLNPRDREVIRRVFGIGCRRSSAVKLAAEWGVSRQYVQRLKREALEALKRRLTSSL